MPCSSDPTRSPFLTAEWRHLAMLNFEVDPAILAPWLPSGTELDAWQGKTLVSLVGFRFLQTRLKGIPIPWHRDFDEVNLRFYVRRRAASGWRRGVVFVRELVPRAAIATVARLIYEEPYLAVPMRHLIEPPGGLPRLVEYGWSFRDTACHLRVETTGDWHPPEPGGTAEFITEHYWGYTKRKDGSTSEYEVAHPPWRVITVSGADYSCDVAALYGACFVPFTHRKAAFGAPRGRLSGHRLLRRASHTRRTTATWLSRSPACPRQVTVANTRHSLLPKKPVTEPPSRGLYLGDGHSPSLANSTPHPP
jgi:hypothetical protein